LDKQESKREIVKSNSVEGNQSRNAFPRRLHSILMRILRKKKKEERGRRRREEINARPLVKV